MSTYKSLGIVLRRNDFNEYDRIYTILSQNGEVIEAIARGIRKPTAKLSAHLELFSVVDLMLASGKKFDVIISARQRKFYLNIKKDITTLRLGFLFCEMIFKLNRGTSLPETYNLLAESLQILNTGKNISLCELYFKLHLLKLLGYEPNLHTEVNTKELVNPKKKYRFSIKDGGLIENKGESLDREQLKLWRLIYKYPLKKLVKINNTKTPAELSMSIVNEFYDYLFDKKFKSNEL